MALEHCFPKKNRPPESDSMITLLLLLASAPTEWPGFRGDGGGVSPSKTLPLEWSPKVNIAWKADLPGYGQSSPVVWKGRVYVTSVDGAKREKGHIVALDAKTGKQLWKHDFEPHQKADWGFSVSKAAPTPVADEAGVYAFFEGGNLLALSHDGKLLWSRSLVKDHGEFKNGHGLGGSPAQTVDTLYFLIDHQGPSYLLAVDKKTGKDRWKVERKERSSWSSPIIASGQLVASSNGSVAGYALADGKKLWEVDGLVGNTIPSASPAPGGVLVGAGVGQRGGDAAKSAASNTFIRLSEKGLGEQAWKAKNATAGAASPLAYEGHAYFVNAAGVVYCLDLKTGEEKFTSRIGGPCWASPVAANGRVYFFSRNGTATVLKAGPELKKLATNKLWDAPEAPPKEGKGERPAMGGNTVYGVAAVGGAFFVRTGKTVTCIRKP